MVQRSIFVEVQSADSDPVDDLITSATGGYALGTMTNSAGVYRNTMTWSGTVDSVDINVLWSKASFGDTAVEHIECARGGCRYLRCRHHHHHHL